MSASPGFDSRPMHESARSRITFCCSGEASKNFGELSERVFLGGVKSRCLDEGGLVTNVRKKVDDPSFSRCKQRSAVLVEYV
jgi:hypothetical protein